MFKRKIITTTGALFSSSLLLVSAAHATTPQYKDQQALHDIANAVSKTRIEQDIQTLVDFGTRHTLSETKSDTRGIGAARRWIKSEFEAISKACGNCLEDYRSKRHYFR